MQQGGQSSCKAKQLAGSAKIGGERVLNDRGNAAGEGEGQQIEMGVGAGCDVDKIGKLVIEHQRGSGIGGLPGGIGVAGRPDLDACQGAPIGELNLAQETTTNPNPTPRPPLSSGIG